MAAEFDGARGIWGSSCTSPGTWWRAYLAYGSGIFLHVVELEASLARALGNLLHACGMTYLAHRTRCNNCTLHINYSYRVIDNSTLSTVPPNMIFVGRKSNCLQFKFYPVLRYF